MADQPVRFTPLGNLDKDSEYKLVGKGNYIDALDIIKQDDSSQVSGTIQPTKRNKHAFSLGSVQAQNKKYRVTVDGDATKSHAIKFLSTKRDKRITTGSGTGGSVAFDGTIASLQTAFNQSNLPGAFQVTVSGDTMEFELVAYNYYQWYLDSVGDDDVEVVCIQEAIPTDLAGPLKDIGSYDLLGELFIFSTTQDNEPTELDVQIAGVGPLSPNPSSPPPNVFSGPLTQLFFNGLHGLQEGQWIRIIDSSAAWLNGVFVVNNIISPTDVNIVTDTAWGATHPASSVGPAKVFIHPTGIGEIGVAQKNNNTEDWSYIRLIRSTELNLISRKPIDIHVHSDSSGDNLYYTDDYNQPRKFKYAGAYIEDGALTYINSENEYEYGVISKQSSLILTSPAVEFVLISQIQSGGKLIAGNKYYVARLVFSAGDNSNWSSISRAINVYTETLNSAPDLLSGNNSIETTKANKIRIDGLDPRFTKRIEVAVIEEISGVLNASIIKKINVGSSSVTFVHSGNEADIKPIDIGSVLPLSDSFMPIKAKNIRSIDSRNVLSNVETLNKIDLTEWVRTFKHSIKRKYISEATKYQSGEYQDPENVFNEIGFMLNETYRVGCRAYIKGLGRTDVFWVDDIRVDTNAANPANPFGNNRRNNTIPNYDLSDQLTAPAYNTLELARFTRTGINTGSSLDPIWQDQMGVFWGTGWDRYADKEFYNDDNGDPLNQSSISRLIVPYINIEDIDYSFNIEALGLPASEAIEALEFFIGDIPNSVKASGVGVMSVETPTNLQNAPILNVVTESGYGGPVDSLFDIDTNSTLHYPKWPEGGDRYIMEWPYTTGSRIASLGQSGNISTTDMALNYPVQSFPYGEKFVERKDFISFYSGDTVFNESEGYAGEELIVFGTCDLQNNFKTQKIPQDSKYTTFRNPRSSSYWAKFSPRLTSDTYASYGINSQEYVNTSKLPPVSGLDYDSTEGGPNVGVNWFADVNAPTAEDLFSATIGGERFSKRLPMFTRWEIKNRPGEVPWIPKLAPTILVYQKGPVIKLDTPIDLNDSNISPSFVNNFETLRYGNRGVVYCQIYTDETDLYPEITDTNYISIGSILITPTGTSGTEHALTCGDTHTQTSIVKHRSSGATIEDLKQSSSTIDVTIMDPIQFGLEGDEFELAKELYETGFGSAIIATCQNRVNSNMFTVEEDIESDQLYYPKDTTKDWLNAYAYQTIPAYNPAYNGLKNIFLSAYYTSNLFGGIRFDFPTRIMYSLLKDESGIHDEYRVFLPLNIKDLDLSFGEIIHHEDINGELFTLQPRKYQLQYFNTRGTLQGSNEGVEILIGDGSVLSRDGQTLSSYGTQHKWSVVKGSSPGGKDVIYWFNQENGLFMRFGADGTVVLSERSGIRSFAANDTRWTENQYTPALNYGIRSVWDDRFKEAIWTFIGVRENRGDWGVGNKYGEGDIVIGSTFDNYSFDGIPDVYISISPTHTSSLQTEPGVGGVWEAYWKLADKDDPEYYSVFTLAFNELSNGFSTFYSHLPKTYLKWKNKFLSSHPTERSEIYEHRYGYDKWYEYEGVWKESEPYLEGVVNPFPDQSKKFVAIQALTDNVPDRIELITKDHESFLVATDFDPEDDAWRTPIKNDILTSQTGDPNDDTVSLIGSYMRVKFKFFNGAYNKMNNLVVKVRQRLRRTQS